MPNRVALLREILVAVALLVCVVAVTVGAAMFAPAAGWVVGGLGGAAWIVAVSGDLS